ncbi:MAG TPA: chromosome partitioning protein ParA, partial [Chitinophagaceae bacterium]|nr:chromosome partitioning protein ParA [Chitinophagaceae bacterium]
LNENHRLKDNLNKMLEEQVRIKTGELLQKQAFIEEQNHQLENANHQLEAQAREIAEINKYLARDNRKLQHDISEVREARALSKEMTFQEFCDIYHDRDGWTRFIAELKWQDGYSCRKCGYPSFSMGRTPYSRRCSRCGYDESAIANTLLQGTHLPVEKALYLVFLVYNSQGSISSHKLSVILDTRQSTCWSYSSRIKSILKERQRAGLVEANGWSDIILHQ